MMGRLVFQTVIWLGALAALMFVSAGTLAWPGAWAFLIETGLIGFAIGAWFAFRDPALLAERLSPPIQAEQPRSDKIVIAAILAVFVAWFVVMAFDAARWRLSHVPPWLQAVGAVALALCLLVAFLTFRANSFAAPVVKIQTGRGQYVVTDGPYAWVRHPMYAGVLLYLVGVPLLLGSWWGLAFVPVLTVLFAIRAVLEERTLSAGLTDYAAYAARVRYRLVPGIW
jgi:protein-S-isoprenylcysteine O-methyltransferase Ste14